MSTYHEFNKHKGWIKHSHCWEEKCPEVCEKLNWDYWKNDNKTGWENDPKLTIQCGKKSLIDMIHL